MIFVTQILFCTQNNTDSIWCLKKKNDVKNTSIFILVFYNNIHCSFVTLLSFFFNTEKDDMVVIHLSIYVWSTREMSRTHLNMFWIYTSPPPPINQFNVVLITLRLFHSFEMSKDPTPWSLITTFMAFVHLYVFFFNRKTHNFYFYWNNKLDNLFMITFLQKETVTREPGEIM